MTRSAIDVYGSALENEPSALRVHGSDGTVSRLPVDRWRGPLTAADENVLDRARPPVLDVGCGPGRHVLALARKGNLALGVDIAPAAVRTARRRGAPVLEASVFDRIPGDGTWASALLLDGNIGIGGAPEALLRRLRQLLCTDGQVFVELEPPGRDATRGLVRLEAGGELSDWFAWARVGADTIDEPARTAGFAVDERWEIERRWFARLVPS
jgi:SAM-dependent methyltransferase